MREFETSRRPMPATPSGAGGAVTPGASPYIYTAAESGLLYVSGGVVSLIQFQRPGFSIMPVGVVAGPLYARSGDKLTITYTVAPVMNWLPL